jgi:hypothetical protein
MDKLLNISRPDSYPLCAETLQVLYDNARAVNVLLAELNLPNKSAVILGTESFAMSVAGYKYLYVVTTGNRRLVRYETRADVLMSNLTSAKVTITETTHNVHDNNGVEIAGVYSEERAVIENTDNANERWTFYHLRDVLELGVYTDLLPQFRAQLANTNVSLDENYGNILCKNDRKLRVKLKLEASVSNNPTPISSEEYTMEVSIPAGISGAQSLNAVLLYNSQYRPLRAMLIGTTLKIYAGEALDSIVGSQTEIYGQAWTMYVNSEILL